MGRRRRSLAESRQYYPYVTTLSPEMETDASYGYDVPRQPERAAFTERLMNFSHPSRLSGQDKQTAGILRTPPHVGDHAHNESEASVEYYGFADEGLDFIIDYDIKYRMSLGAGGQS